MENFDTLNLKPELKRAVADLGYTKPSPIQAQALPILLGEPTDFIGLAATGTGKTAAFSLPLLQRIDAQNRDVQALILCPTRELSLQVSQQIDLYGKALGIRSVAIYGGAGYDEQLRALKSGVPIVVGTPGRIMDHMERGTLRLGGVRNVVLDEADEMISMGFREDIETILKSVARDQSNIWLFSATMNGPVRKVADHFLKNPKMAQVNKQEMLSSTVEQIYYMTQDAHKPEILCKIIDAADDFYGVVFCQTKSLVADLARYLSERQYKAGELHGDMSQGAREAMVMAFRQKRVKIMVCTDVASRGLDIKDVTHVVNFSIPRELDNYVHRIGRTARSGKSGIAISLVTPSHRHLISRIEHLTKSKLKEGIVPTRKEIGMKKIGMLRAQFLEQPGYVRALELMDEQWKQSVAGMNPEEVAARFLTMMFPWVFAEERRPQMARSQTPQAPAPNDRPRRANDGRRDDRPRRANDSKDERRYEKRTDKRDFKKKFTKGFHGAKKRNDRYAPTTPTSGPDKR